MTAPQTLGSWPYVDIVLVRDYEQSQRMQGKAGFFVRIHMDIPIADPRDLDVINDLLKQSKHKEVYEKVIKVAPPDPDPASRGLATLRAALGQ
jgi:hypothetical protein